jgi:hypothetical protein
MASDVDELSLRLERLTAIAKELEIECAESADARRTFEALQREIETIRLKLRVLNRP